MIGGYQSGVRVLTTVEMYNPTANTWTTKAAMPTPRYLLAGALGSDGRIYAMGGSNDSSTYLSTVEAYDPTLNAWSSAASMPTARDGLAAATLGSRVYAVGGRTPASTHRPWSISRDPRAPRAPSPSTGAPPPPTAST